MYAEINKYINKKISLNADELLYFNEILEYKKYKKKEIIIKEGDICNIEAYVKKGLFRTYYINEKGNEVDLFFASEDWWIGDLISFSQQIPSKFYIQALEESEVLILSYHKKEKLFSQIPAFERLFRLMIQKAYETMINRFVATTSDTAESRYLEFIKKYPSIPLRVTQQMIASYLGITPEFLSKIRTNLSKNKNN